MANRGAVTPAEALEGCPAAETESPAAVTVMGVVAEAEKRAAASREGVARAGGGEGAVATAATAAEKAGRGEWRGEGTV